MSRKFSEYPVKTTPAGTDTVLIVDNATSPATTKHALISSLPSGLANAAAVVAALGGIVNNSEKPSASILQDGTVTADKLASNAVTNAKINNGAVSRLKIAGNAIDAERLWATNTATAGDVLARNGNTGNNAPFTWERARARAPAWNINTSYVAGDQVLYNSRFWGARRAPTLMIPGGSNYYGSWQVVAASQTTLGTGEAHRVTQNTNLLYLSTTPSNAGAKAGSDGVISSAAWFTTTGAASNVTLLFSPDGNQPTSITNGTASFVNVANNRLEVNVTGLTANIGTTAGGVIHLWNTNNSAEMVRRPPDESADWTQLDFPAPPGTAGSYDLRIVVDAQGNAVKQWVAASQLHGQGIPNPF